MIYTDKQLVEKIRKMIVDFENEVVEFKEARSNFFLKISESIFQHWETKRI
jgi:ATP-dependent DNA helicase RecG